ncbi:hypothetical protein PCANC_26607 [Puccinia coronata f. sp. avenae]|uniref:UPF3 domain-containing protein n=1 Tax=Puccinia coronata f. sp. avenae TaxID=200324 RepID=A0A2N5S0H4_9BASI|nr:hypothetical protein PCANC_26607 [Puccinia coronata f. sp. avenae]
MPEVERTKLVVRHLPPSLPEEVFWKTLSRWLDPIPLEDGSLAPPRCRATFKSYLPGKTSRNKTKVEIPSRAYIQFATTEQVVEFHQGYASQAFRDAHGNITFPKVEFAPYPKVAGPPRKVDSRIGTIDTDNEYQAFLERLNAPAPTSPINPDTAPEKVEKPQITPLIEHLRNARKAAQEAATTAKQQRQAATSGKSASGRSFTGTPQVMKRPAANPASNSPADVPARKSGDPSHHDPPANSAQSSSKAGKQTSKPSSTGPSSASQTTSAPPNNPPKSRSNKPPKSKKAERAAGDQSSHPPATASQGKSSAGNHPPKTILQPPKTSDSNAEPPKSTPTQPPTHSPSKGGNSSRKKHPSALPEQSSSKNETAKAPSSAREGAAGPKKSSRGGKGGKAASNAAANPASKQAEPSSSSPQKAKNQDVGKAEPNSGETAAARRRLGNALAGITSKPDRPPRKKQNSKPAPPATSSNPPAAD